MFRTGLFVLVTLGLLSFPTTLGEAELSAEPPVDTHQIVAGDAWTARIEWAIARYEAAGMELPSATITAHAGKAPCSGNMGLYSDGPTPEIHLCVDDPDSTKGRLIVLHELGHLWAENRLDQEIADRFLALRGLDTWKDGDVVPHEWGAEHAAEVLSWGLMDELMIIIRIDDASPEALTEGFEVLTGTTPPVMAGA